VHLVADADFEGPVEDVEELVLAGVDVRRRPSAGGGEVLDEHKASAGALTGGLEGHSVTDDPEALAFAGGDGVAVGGGCAGGVHGSIFPGEEHQCHFINCWDQ